MLQALLARRFQLQYHRETKESPVYLLVRTNKPPDLRDTGDKQACPWVGSVAGTGLTGDGIRGTNASMQLLAARLSDYLEQPVFDRTGLTGSFDFRYEIPVAERSGFDLVSSIKSSVQGLGLNLQAGKGPVELLVIDHADKPSGN